MDGPIDTYLGTIANALHQIAHADYKRWTDPEFLEWLEQGEEWLSEGHKKFGHLPDDKTDSNEIANRE